MEGNLYLFELIFDDAKPIKDTCTCNDIKEVWNYIENNYGLDWEDLRFFNIERLRKGY